MIHLKDDVYSALTNNQALFNLVDGRIYPQTGTGVYPCITFFEMDNFDNRYADDDPYASRILFQVDVWSKGSTTAMAQEVDKTMKSLGFTRGSSADLYEDDVKLYHKAMRYKISKTF